MKTREIGAYGGLVVRMPVYANTCGVDEASGIPADTSEKNLFSIDWTRFGEVSIDKWSPAKTEWVLLQ